jgi:adenylylsulfate kinase-like enzyme
MILLLFGQPASGKTTLADIVANEWENWTEVSGAPLRIDGDKWREITKNKDYSKEGRVRNLRGAFDMALYLEKEGFTVILSFVTPYQELRDYLKSNAENFTQVFLNYEGGRGRDEKFATDFEIPSKEDCLILNTAEKSIEECAKDILTLLKISDYLTK